MAGEEVSNAPPQAAVDPRLRAIGNELRAAAERAEAAAARLNRRHSGCPDCGHKRFEAFNEANAYDYVVGAAKRLRRWAEALEHPEQYTVRGTRRDDFDADDE